eukprot:SAG31_NODE_4029_length_3650_cov_1.509716_3_plen_62_part_00
MIRKWDNGKFATVPIYTVVDDATIAKHRPTPDDPPDAVPRITDMKDAREMLKTYPDLARLE